MHVYNVSLKKKKHNEGHSFSHDTQKDLSSSFLFTSTAPVPQKIQKFTPCFFFFTPLQVNVMLCFLGLRGSPQGEVLDFAQLTV